MSKYELWTVTPIGEMDVRIADGIAVFDDVEAMAQKQANDRDAIILILWDQDQSVLVYPDDEPRWQYSDDDV